MSISNQGQGSHELDPTSFRYQNKNFLYLKIAWPFVTRFLYVLCLYLAQISGEHLEDHWSTGFRTCNVLASRNILLIIRILLVLFECKKRF